MANEKMNIEIQDFEDKKSQNGKRYSRFKTNNGWMSAFDKEIIDALKDNEGKSVCVEVATDEEKGFKNIRKFIGKPEKIEVVSPKTFGGVTLAPMPIVNQARNTSSMYVSYAKDIFIELCNNPKNEVYERKDIMNLAIELVKQAKSAFEEHPAEKAEQ